MKVTRTYAAGLVVLVLAGVPDRAAAQDAEDLHAEIDRLAAEVRDDVIAWRRDIHQNPELGNREVRTAGIVSEHLRSLGLDEVRTDVAHTGVVGILRGGRPGPVVGLRADMDALPVTEMVDVPFASTARSEYNGQEVGQEEETSLFDKDCLDWSRADDHILRFYKKLIGLRKDFPALSSRQLNPIQNNHSKLVVSFEKVKDEQKMLILLNFSNQSLKLKIDLPLKYHNTKDFEDVFSGNSLRAEELRALEIKPHGFYILKPVGNII